MTNSLNIDRSNKSQLHTKSSSIFRQTTVLVCLGLLLQIASLAQRPNIIFIMTDDMGYGDLSCYGNNDYQTPNIDRLASQGMKFTNAYSGAPICTPTRTSFITGRYPARTPVGLIEPLTATPRDTHIGITPEFPSIPGLLQANGYETILIGKWHLGLMAEHSPLRNGYDYYYGIRSGAADYHSHRRMGKNHDLFENDSMVYTKGYLTEIFSQKAIEFLQRKHEKPFLLTINFNAPHWPWQGPADKPYDDTSDLRAGGSKSIYEAMVLSLDQAIGDIMHCLEGSNLYENTLVIFTNDNGGERYSDNAGLSNAKGTLWEGGIRVPAIASWPGKIRAGTISDQVIITMDWSATILSLSGVSPNPSFPLDGTDLTPFLTGKQENINRTIYWRTYQRTRQKAMRMGKWKYLLDEKGEYLFDLSVDEAEKVNLKEIQTQIFLQLKNLYAQWEKTMLQPVPL